MTEDERLTHLNRTLEAIQNGWPFFLAEMDQKISDLTEKLIDNDNEQTRGRIKALRELKRLREDLSDERDRISADLLERDSA